MHTYQINLFSFIHSLFEQILKYEITLNFFYLNPFNFVDRCMRNFIWLSDVDTQKIVIVAWSEVFQPLIRRCWIEVYQNG